MSIKDTFKKLFKKSEQESQLHGSVDYQIAKALSEVAALSRRKLPWYCGSTPEDRRKLKTVRARRDKARRRRKAMGRVRAGKHQNRKTGKAA